MSATPARRSRPHLFYDTVRSLCSTCLEPVDGKYLIEDDRVLLDKWCPDHGRERVLVADDATYWRRMREQFLKPAEMPWRFQTPMRYGCPYDCGICPDHQQHACVALVEINDRCNLNCPICYASSGTHRTEQRSLAEIEAMLDAVVDAERAPDVVQISGGEPTLHPDLFAILDAAKARPIRHLMLNTNGVRLAADPSFVRRLAAYQPGFEIYLQFDSLRDEALLTLRGARLAATRTQALRNLEACNLSTTLVCTVERGVNDDEIGEIIDFATRWRCVRGVTPAARPGGRPHRRLRPRPPPPHPHRGPPPHRRAVRPLRRRRPRPRPLPPRRAGHGLRPQAPRPILIPPPPHPIPRPPPTSRPPTPSPPSPATPAAISSSPAPKTPSSSRRSPP